MSLIVFLIISAGMIFYLAYQSKEDVKDQTVPVLPGLIAVAVSILLYGIGSLVTLTIPDFKNIAICFIAILLMWLFKIFGSGDAKAFFAIAMISAFTPGKQIFHSLDILLLVITYFFSTVTFMPVCVVKGIKNHRTIKEILFGKGERVAYFPYILAGYIMAVILYTLTYI